jgi:MFS family permease
MGTAFGVFSSMIGLAAVSGPVIGGLLTTYLSWRWVFYVNLSIAAVGIALSRHARRASRGRGARERAGVGSAWPRGRCCRPVAGGGAAGVRDELRDSGPRTPSYIEAMHWALAVPVAVLIAGALACLTMRPEAETASAAPPVGLTAAASVGEA